MNVGLNGEAEHRDLDVESITLFVDHHIMSLHGAHRRFDHGTAGVLKFVARRNKRLFTDHAFTLNFRFAAITVGNQPVTSQQLLAGTAQIASRHAIGADVTIIIR